MNVLKHRSHINGKMLSLHEQYMMCHSMNQCDNTWEGFHLYFMFGFALIFCLNLIICGQDTVRIKLQTFPTMIMSSRCITGLIHTMVSPCLLSLRAIFEIDYKESSLNRSCLNLNFDCLDGLEIVCRTKWHKTKTKSCRVSKI